MTEAQRYAKFAHISHSYHTLQCPTYRAVNSDRVRDAIGEIGVEELRAEGTHVHQTVHRDGVVQQANLF